MPPKQQDMSVRDEDQLARDQSLDQLKDQLRASLGYEGGADGLVSMESGELHRFMGELGDKIAEHDRLIVAPPWLAKLQAQVARLEGEVVDLRGSLAESRAEVLELRSALQARPVSPEHGAGLSLTRQSTKASVSCTYASLYRDMKKSNGMSALPVKSFEKMRAVFGYMLSVAIIAFLPRTSARWS